RHVEARRASFDAAQHQVLHGIEADCSTPDGIAYRGSHLIGAEYAGLFDWRTCDAKGETADEADNHHPHRHSRSPFVDIQR
ncbi:MAG: hypothetical protein ACRECV_05720, partial [Xanthobacteraceae bacterium]